MSLKRGFFTFGGWTLMSRIVGFVRDMMLAAVVGAGPLGDAFVVAQRLPNMFRGLFAEGAFSAAFVPLFTHVRQGEGHDAARKFAAEANAVLVTALLVFVGIMMAGMPWVIRAIAPGFGDDPYRFGIAVTLAQIAFPYLLLISLTALQGGVLNAIGRLAPFAAAPALYNVIQIIVFLLLPTLINLGADAGKTLAFSISLGGVGQWLLLAYYCRRAGFTVKWQKPQLTQHVRTFLRRLGPGVIGAGANQINIMLATVLGSLLPIGTVSQLYYADRLNQLPIGVIGVAVVTATLPLLSQAVHDKDNARISETFSRAIVLGMAFGLPAAVGLMALAYPIFEVLFVRGEFTSTDAMGSAIALAGYAVGVPAYILLRTCATRFHAAGDTTTPVRAAMVAVAANVAGGVWLMQVWGAFGITLAVSLASWVNFLVLRWRLAQQGSVKLDADSRKRIGKIIFASAAMGIVAYELNICLSPMLVEADVHMKIVLLAGMVAGGIATYAVLIIGTGALSLGELKVMLKRPKKTENPDTAPDVHSG